MDAHRAHIADLPGAMDGARQDSARARAPVERVAAGHASLPWYDLTEIVRATDLLWSHFAVAFRSSGMEGVPSTVERSIEHVEQWRSDRLLFSQACGYDTVISAREHIQVLATPRYRAPGCEGAAYSSFIVVREDAPYRDLADLRGARCAVNSLTSHSGMNALRSMVAPLHRHGRFFSHAILTGSHERSLEQIQAGFADVAGIDCVTHALLGCHRPALLQGTRVLCRSRSAAAPPYVTRRNLPPADLRRMREALHAAIGDPALEHVRRTLLLDGVEFLPPTAHDGIAELERDALDLGYDLVREMSPCPDGVGNAIGPAAVE